MANKEEAERRIRERAYKIWQEEGCPEGHADQNWLRAQWLLALEDAPNMMQEESPAVLRSEPGETKHDPKIAGHIEAALSLFRYQRKY